MITFTIIAAVVSLLIVAVTYVVMLKITSAGANSGIAERIEEVKVASQKINKLIGESDKYAAKAQFDTLMKQIDDAKAGLLKEKENQKKLEQKLSTVQSSVETKEVQHQEMKTAKEEEELKLSELIANYEGISQESITLEQKLAASLKSLDSMIDGMEMSDEQRAAVQELSNTLTNASSNMRDLLTEYSMVKERLDTIIAQHADLEEEYTRLVEQQLGEGR